MKTVLFGFQRALMLSGICALTCTPLSSCGARSGTLTVPMSPLRDKANKQRTSSSYTVLYRFIGGNDGQYPAAGLVYVKGRLYGATSSGGSSDCGTAFSLGKGGTHKVLYSFACGYDGDGPSGLTDVKGMMYGTTALGGAYGYGTVFSISKAGVHSVLHSFGGGGDGAYPSSNLINVKGTLYGTTTEGGGYECGGNGCGTIYSITTAGGETAISYFGDGSDGSAPVGGVIPMRGTFYGVTWRSPACQNFGTLYSVAKSGGQIKFLYCFAGGSDGYDPTALITANGVLYGATEKGGSSSCDYGLGCGTFFSMSTSGDHAVLYSFEGEPDGAYPNGLINVSGTLYGTTSDGGTGADGTIYRISTTGAEGVLYSLTGVSDGSDPEGLLNVQGTFYGTTVNGGSYNCYESLGCGVVFIFKP